ncbi:MAG TPA: DUF3820 family protein [Chthoniobacterales bacterium]|jgi:hypothetical protein
MSLEETLRSFMQEDLSEIIGGRMPFGKFGPKFFPPVGVPLYDLPVEYLEWFSKKGFPKGRLGELLKIVHQLKVEGCDEIFDATRRKRGGRTSLRPRDEAR